MPLVDYSSLPDGARTWTFGSATPLDPSAEAALLAAVDAFLTQWKAHGTPLTVARSWRDRHFLTVAVDTTQAHASGCSIDGLFRELQQIDARFGSSLVGGGRLFYRDSDGVVQCVERRDVDACIASGQINESTEVFDTTVATLGEWRTRFETVAEQHWIGALLPKAA